MDTLTIVFTGLVFYATPPEKATHTNAVLVTGNTPFENHGPELKFSTGAVEVTKNGLSDEKRSWTLGPSAIVVVGDSVTPPLRTDAFKAYVPSVGLALKGAGITPKGPSPCTYSKVTNKVVTECMFQKGRIQLSGGTLDAVPTDDEKSKEYYFLTDSLKGDYKSGLASTTKWVGLVETITIHDKGTYLIKVGKGVTMEVSNHPTASGADLRHFGVLRHLYGLSGGGSQADFPRPRVPVDELQAAATRTPFDFQAMMKLLRPSPRWPVLCPPATQ